MSKHNSTGKHSSGSKKRKQVPAEPEGPRQLTLTPQLLLGLAPDGTLFAEVPNHSGSRKRVQLAEGEVERELYRLLYQRQSEIAAEKLEQEELAGQARARQRRQPDWRLIARHPEAEIRERTVPVTVLPQQGNRLSTVRCRKDLEEMGL